MEIIKSKTFYKTIFAITLPIALQNLINLATSMMDSLMLGRAENTGLLLSAASLANQPFFILSLISFGLASASTVLTAQYWGKRDMESIRRIISAAIKTAFLLSSIMGLAVLIFPEWVMGIYSNNENVIEAGAKYLRIVGFSYFTFGFSSTMLCCIRGVELVKISVAANLSSFFLNTFLNWVLIFGNLGAPALGIQGAAIATLTARIAELLITIIYIFLIDKRLCFKVRDLFTIDPVLTKDYIKYGTPVFFNELFWSVGISIQAAILGHITYSAGDPVAANSITGMVQQLATVVIMGTSNAAAVVIGKSIGAGFIDRAKKEAFTLAAMSVVLGVFACGFILLIKNMVIGFYTIPPETAKLANQFMIVIAFIVILISFASMGIVGILRAGGDTKFCLFSEMSSMWFVAIPAAVIAAALHSPVPLVLLLTKIDEPIKCTIMIFRMKSDKWIKSVTR